MLRLSSQPCSECDGEGHDEDGTVCGTCRGTGVTSDTSDDGDGSDGGTADERILECAHG